jgi:hypothetical protein
MQSADLEQKVQYYVRKMPFIKAIILSDLEDDIEIYKYIANDLEFKENRDDNFMNGLRGGINELYSDFKEQLRKLGEC